MQTKRNKLDYGMMLLPSLDEFVPKDHYLRKLDRVLDLSFVHEAVSDKYCQDNGRPSIDPEAIVRLFLLQAIEGIPSIRKLMQRAHVDLAYRWFIGYRVDEKLPDHSTLSRALDRFGDKVFNELFKRSVSQCQSSGLIDGKVLHLDATTIRADIDSTRVNKPNSSDKDARFGRFPGDNIKPGYKQHTIADGKNRVVLAVSVTPANSSDDATMTEMVDDVFHRLETVPEAVCADGAYGSGKNRADLEERDIRLVSPPRKAKIYGGGKYFTVADFEYNEVRDEFVCPAGKQLRYVGGVKDRPDQRRYRSSRRICGCCSLKGQCTRAVQRQVKVSKYYASLVRLRADSKTDSFKRLYRNRAPVIEGVFAESKQWHGLGRAWRRGLSKMLVQCLLVATVLNLKRLGTLPDVLSLLKALYEVIICTLRRVWSESNRNTRQQTFTNTLTFAIFKNKG